VGAGDRQDRTRSHRSIRGRAPTPEHHRPRFGRSMVDRGDEGIGRERVGQLRGVGHVHSVPETFGLGLEVRVDGMGVFGGSRVPPGCSTSVPSGPRASQQTTPTTTSKGCGVEVGDRGGHPPIFVTAWR